MHKLYQVYTIWVLGGMNTCGKFDQCLSFVSVFIYQPLVFVKDGSFNKFLSYIHSWQVQSNRSTWTYMAAKLLGRKNHFCFFISQHFSFIIAIQPLGFFYKTMMKHVFISKFQ